MTNDYSDKGVDLITNYTNIGTKDKDQHQSASLGRGSAAHIVFLMSKRTLYCNVAWLIKPCIAFTFKHSTGDINNVDDTSRNSKKIFTDIFLKCYFYTIQN